MSDLILSYLKKHNKNPHLPETTKLEIMKCALCDNLPDTTKCLLNVKNPSNDKYGLSSGINLYDFIDHKNDWYTPGRGLDTAVGDEWHQYPDYHFRKDFVTLVGRIHNND